MDIKKNPLPCPKCKSSNTGVLVAYSGLPYGRGGRQYCEGTIEKTTDKGTGSARESLERIIYCL